MGIEFSYECEGWVLPGGQKYLPDFYLPQFRTWIEVKPGAFTDQEYKKCQLVACGRAGELFLLLDGDPMHRSYEGLSFDGVELDSNQYGLDIEQYGGKYRNQGRLFCDPESLIESDYTLRYRGAVRASREMRFDTEKDRPVWNVFVRQCLELLEAESRHAK